MAIGWNRQLLRKPTICMHRFLKESVDIFLINKNLQNPLWISRISLQKEKATLIKFKYL
jgi:hypothetical protein